MVERIRIKPMYEKFFGLKEKPFKLVPDPDYLFLSQTHEDAMAHLVYAVAQGEGFVEITGEVGTGKTTLCRAFLEKLDEKTAAAYIFNPVLEPLHLLKTVCQEFGLPAATDDTQELLSQLNAFLIEKKRQGGNVLLLIDEAQDLPREVLEQLRLLSNLETTKSKLLQIVMVGQPELTDLLNTRQLRQLRQRITLRWQLKPLALKDTIEYIRYRIQRAAELRPVEFSLSAMRSVYRYTKGIPRLINIVCDRALLVAYHANRKKISDGIVRRAIRELDPRTRSRTLLKTAAACGVVLLAAVLLFYHRQLGPGFSDESPPASVQSALPAAPAEPVGSVTVPASSEPAVPTHNQVLDSPKAPEVPDEMTREPVDFESYLWRAEDLPDRREAFSTLMNLWETEFKSGPTLNDVADDAVFFQMAAQKSGFQLYSTEGALDIMRRLNLPVILEMSVPGVNYTVYLVLAGLENGRFWLSARDAEVRIPADERDLMLYWSGNGYIPWLNFYGISGTLPSDGSAESVRALKMLLKDIGFDGVDLNPEYDAATEAAVRSIQEKHGIPVDGVVGSMTKIAMYNEMKSFGMPHLAEQQ